jgi:hypothetical protein
MTAPGETNNPDFTSASYVTADIIEHGKGKSTSDNPKGELYVAQIAFQETNIQGQENRVDLHGMLQGTPFNTQGDIDTVQENPQEAISAAQQATDILASTLAIK